MLRRNQNPKRINSFCAVFLLLLILYSFNVYAEDKIRGDIVSLKKNFIDLMNQWVSFRWGLNCVVYVLYYSPSILEPWAELNAKLNGWSDAEKEEFRKSVEDTLKIGKNLAFLLTIENLGKEPINLSPLIEKVFLEDSKGNKYKISTYEAHLDSPITNKVQGLIFFPLVPKGVNRITLRVSGLPDGDALFSWNLESQAPKMAEEKRELSWEQVLASKENNPKDNKVDTQKVEVKVVKPEGQVKTNIKPTPPEPPKVKQPPSPKQEESKKLQEKPQSSAVPEVKIGTEEIKIEGNAEKVEELDPVEVLKSYLEAWKAKDYKKMYSLLSSDSRSEYTFSQFVGLVEDKMPGWLKSGDYKVLPPKRKDKETNINLVSTLKLGFIRILETHTFTLILDKEGWRIKF